MAPSPLLHGLTPGRRAECWHGGISEGRRNCLLLIKGCVNLLHWTSSLLALCVPAAIPGACSSWIPGCAIPTGRLADHPGNESKQSQCCSQGRILLQDPSHLGGLSQLLLLGNQSSPGREISAPQALSGLGFCCLELCFDVIPADALGEEPKSH